MRNMLRADNYMKPPIPKGYRYISGKWDDGFTIERLIGKSCFTWVPVGFLDANGTLDGVNFNEKLGRRKWLNEEFSSDKFHEDVSAELATQKICVEVWGGFYISSFNVCKGFIGKIFSQKDMMPYINPKVEKAIQIASSFEKGPMIKSHLPYGVEVDSVNEWFIKSGRRTHKEMTLLSTRMGNHWNSASPPRGIVETGSREEWCTNGIYDWTGNVSELTQERYGESSYVIRGANFSKYGEEFPAVSRSIYKPYSITGFRIVLSISPDSPYTFAPES